MFKYIKWELKDELKRKSVLGIVVVILYLLIYILPSESETVGLLAIPYIIVLLGSILMAYLYGAYRTMKSYQRDTFMLESMIPFNPGTLLLAKYILAIIFNIIFSLVYVLGVAVVLFKEGNLDVVKGMLDFFFQMDFDEMQALLRMLLVLFTTTVAFTSFATLLFLAIKSFFPNLNGATLISITLGLFLFSRIIISYIKNIASNMDSFGEGDILYCIFFLAITAICYFISVIFIRDKLEVYN